MVKNMIWTLFMLTWLAFPLSAAAARQVLVIDPAHGGKDAGVKLSRTVHEKDITLAIARLVKKNLSDTTGITVRLTRSDDRDVSPAERKNILKESDVDLFISLHINAGFGQNAAGYEIYYLGVEVPSTRLSDSEEIVKDMERTQRTNNSVLLAQLVQKNMERVFPRKGRGLRDAPVYLLQSLETPAIQLEMGFSTAIEDREKLKDTRIEKSVADALTRSVKEYFLTGGAS